jgi:hypothetical protein
MFKAIKLAIKYRDLLEPAIEFINVVQNSVKDGQLTKKERGEVMSQMWVIIKKVQLIRKKSSNIST